MDSRRTSRGGAKKCRRQIYRQRAALCSGISRAFIGRVFVESPPLLGLHFKMKRRRGVGLNIFVFVFDFVFDSVALRAWHVSTSAFFRPAFLRVFEVVSIETSHLGQARKEATGTTSTRRRKRRHCGDGTTGNARSTTC